MIRPIFGRVFAHVAGLPLMCGEHPRAVRCHSLPICSIDNLAMRRVDGIVQIQWHGFDANRDGRPPLSVSSSHLLFLRLSLAVVPVLSYPEGTGVLGTQQKPDLKTSSQSRSYSLAVLVSSLGPSHLPYSPSLVHQSNTLFASTTPSTTKPS